ncbi:hypothetical protein PVAP13_3NG140703 [Panicum virgatum]|uniref:Uncharacterized protein n=1 Tax=Panicum virgatum TaxID=38727 RepID=A0A8T0U467_PANVG|nr:hypothetical protein PVAP13_3NG140703 [Panicum virgatum]
MPPTPGKGRGNEWVGLWEAARHQPPRSGGWPGSGMADAWPAWGTAAGTTPRYRRGGPRPRVPGGGDRTIRGPPVGECGFPPCGAQGQRGATAANGGSEGRLLRGARRGGWGINCLPTDRVPRRSGTRVRRRRPVVFRVAW